MIFVENDSMDAAYHFSVEDCFARYIRKNEQVFMLWQTDKTIMLGNNQAVSNETDLEFAKKAGIKIVRRSSGGGAIYTDTGTVLYTVIEPVTGDIEKNRENVAKSIISVLSKMGVSAKREGRNDILIEGKKISGFAQFTSGNYVCTHGSLLYDTDLDTLTNALKPDDSKLHPKGIASIRSRVTNIKPYTEADYSTDEFIAVLKEYLIGGNECSYYILSDNEANRIDNIYKDKYGNKEWNFRI